MNENLGAEDSVPAQMHISLIEQIGNVLFLSTTANLCVHLHTERARGPRRDRLNPCGLSQAVPQGSKDAQIE